MARAPSNIARVLRVARAFTNAGLWMAHCHIAEHAESGMMFSFDVAPRTEGRARSESVRPHRSSHHHGG
jgi:hypothetical protein